MNNTITRCLRPLRPMKQKLLSRLNWTATIHGQGVSFRIPIHGGLGRLNRMALREEAWMFPLLREGLDPRPGLFVDVGVNVGQTLLKLKAVDPNRSCLGFEPDSAAVALVRRLIRMNALPNCRVTPLGLSDEPGILELLTRDPGSAYATLVEGFRKDDFYQHRVVAAVWQGDAALERLARDQPVAMVKIDVEGAELEVVRGLRKTLARHRPTVLCEILPDGLDDTNPGTQLRRRRQGELLEIMNELGYTLERILEDGRLVPLERIEPHEDFSLCQYRFTSPGAEAPLSPAMA